MTVQKVSWEYIKGFDAFVNLMGMLAVAIEGAQLKARKTQGYDFSGFYFDAKNRIYCGIYFNEPLQIVMETLHEKRTKTIYKVQFDLEGEHFFSLNRDEQLERLTQFVKSTYKDAAKALDKK